MEVSTSVSGEPQSDFDAGSASPLPVDVSFPRDTPCLRTVCQVSFGVVTAKNVHGTETLACGEPVPTSRQKMRSSRLILALSFCLPELVDCAGKRQCNGGMLASSAHGVSDLGLRMIMVL